MLAYVPPATARAPTVPTPPPSRFQCPPLPSPCHRCDLVPSRSPAPSSAAELSSVSIGLRVSSVEINAALFVSVRFPFPLVFVSRVDPCELPCPSSSCCYPHVYLAFVSCLFDLPLWSYLLLDCAQPFYIFRCQPRHLQPPCCCAGLEKCETSAEPIIKLSGAVKVY